MKSVLFLFLITSAAWSAAALDFSKPITVEVDPAELKVSSPMAWKFDLMDFAVNDFVRHLQLIAPGKYEINPANAAGKQRILLGKAAIRAYKMQDSARNLTFGSYRIKTEGNDLLIYGSDIQSTVNGMYGFLQDHLGFRWFGPTDEFRHIPKYTKRPKLERIDRIVRPDFLTRELKGYGYPGTPGFLWGIRNGTFKLDGSWDMTANHNLHRMLPGKRYAKSHPEYYSMGSNGKRIVPPEYTQMCYSNAEVEQIVQNCAEQFFRRGYDKVCYSLIPADNISSCQCPQCRALQPNRPDDIYCFTDKFMDFAERIADRIKGKYPDRKLGVSAYGGTTLPPLKKMRNGQYYAVVITPDFTQYADKTYREKELNNYRKWLQQVPGAVVFWHSYSGLCQLAPCYFPSLYADTLKHFYREFHTISFVGDGGTGFWPFNGPQAWMMAKLLWDTKADPQKLLHEYFTTLYGPAAPAVKSLYDHLEKCYLTGSRTGGKWLRNHVSLSVFNYYTAEDVYLVRDAWNRARTAAAGNPEILRRIDYMALKMEPTLQMLEALDLCSRLAEKRPLPKKYSRKQIIDRCTEILNTLEAQWQKTVRTDPALDRFAEQKHRPGFDYTEPQRKEWRAIVSENLVKLLAESPDPRRDALFSADPYRKILLGLEKKEYCLQNNLLHNPGFEIGSGKTPQGADWLVSGAHDWAFFSSQPHQFIFGRTDKGATARGKYCGIIRGTGSGTLISSPAIDISDGCRYFLLDALAWKSRPQDRVCFRILWRDRKGRLMSSRYRSADIRPEQQWVRRRLLVEAPEGACRAAIFLNAENLNQSEARFDEISFRKVQLTPFRNPVLKGKKMPDSNIVNVLQAKDLTGIPSQRLQYLEEGKFRFNGKGTIASNSVLKIQPGKKWKLSGKIIPQEKSGTVKFSVAVQYLDREFRPIMRYNFTRIKGTVTRLTAPCNPSDTILKVASIANWKVNPSARVAFECRQDDSDLPNFQVSQQTGIDKIQEGEIHLSHEVGYLFPAGTLIAEHLPGATYCYLGKVNMEIPPEGVNFSHVFSESKLWPSAAYMRIIVLTDGPIELSNLKLETE